jgi:hypothetical protein
MTNRKASAEEHTAKFAGWAESALTNEQHRRRAEDWVAFHAPENNELLGKQFRLGGGEVFRVMQTGAAKEDIVRLVNYKAVGEAAIYNLPATMVWRLIYEGLMQEI